MGDSNTDGHVMVFRPTMDEFRHFGRYIQYMESLGAHKAGVAKIIPPRKRAIIYLPLFFTVDFGNSKLLSKFGLQVENLLFLR